jgi:hypothetical protein
MLIKMLCLILGISKNVNQYKCILENYAIVDFFLM